MRLHRKPGIIHFGLSILAFGLDQAYSPADCFHGTIQPRGFYKALQPRSKFVHEYFSDNPKSKTCAERSRSIENPKLAHSITAAASISNFRGIFNSSDLPVLRLVTGSTYISGCRGKSSGLA